MDSSQSHVNGQASEMEPVFRNHLHKLGYLELKNRLLGYLAEGKINEDSLEWYLKSYMED